MPDQPKELLSAHVRSDVPCPRIALAVDVLRRFGRLRFRATGGSMLPAIAPGDLLEFHRCSAEALRRNDVVLLRRNGGLVAHRVVAVGPGSLVTRGDALPANDAPWDPRDVMGRLVGHRRGHRHLHPGGRHWNRRQRISRWLLCRVPVTQALFHRIPALTAMVS